MLPRIAPRLEAPVPIEALAAVLVDAVVPSFAEEDEPFDEDEDEEPLDALADAAVVEDDEPEDPLPDPPEPETTAPPPPPLRVDPPVPRPVRLPLN